MRDKWIIESRWDSDGGEITTFKSDSGRWGFSTLEHPVTLETGFATEEEAVEAGEVILEDVAARLKEWR
jgi:hypothetical protein